MIKKSNTVNKTPFCLEKLEDRILSLNGSPITQEESRGLLVDLTGCFIEVGRKIVGIQEISEILILHYENQNRRESDSDWLKSSAIWFSEKVLPTLISTGIIAAILWFASVNGHLAINP